MTAAAQEPKTDTRAAFNVNTDDEFPLKSIPGNHQRSNPISTAGPCLQLEGRPYSTSSVFTWVWWEGPDMKNTLIFRFISFFLQVFCGGSPGPQKRNVKLEGVIAAFDNRKFPKHIKENLPATFPKEREEILASFASSSTDPGAVAESKTRLLLDSGASFHAVGEPGLLTGIELFSIDKWAVLPDGTRLRIVGPGNLQMYGFSIPKVYLVDGLKNNLISVSQLDKDHGLCCCFHSKKCEVILADGTVVGGAILQDDGLYELSFLEVPAEPEE